MLARVHSLLLLTVGVIFMYARYDAIENSANQLVCVCVCACARAPKCQLVSVCAHFQGAKGLGPGIGARIDEIDIEPKTPKSKGKRASK